MVSKDKTTVTFHNGILTIGGTVIEVAYKNSHIFFDFGTEFHPEIDLKDESLQTLIKHHHIPELNHVFDPRLGYVYQGEDTKNYDQTAVFLSHAHLDHTKMINFLDPNIPLYTSKATKKIVELLNANGEFLIENPFLAPLHTREMIEVAPFEVVEIGDIKVEFVPVDHDAYGACGFIITTPTCSLAYTGDLRLHGYFPEDTLTYTQKAFQTDCLMMEGVSVSWPERKERKTSNTGSATMFSEEALIARIMKTLEENPLRPVAFNGYPANIKRFIEICEKSPRKVVLTAKIAALIKEITGKDEHYYYFPEEKRIETLDPRLEISYHKIIEEPLTYFWQITKNFKDLPKCALYIHSDAEPLGDFDPKYQRFLNELDSLGVEFIRLSCSGHAVPDDLKKIIAAIEPKLLVPIHTLHPESLENPYGERILPHRGQKILF